MVSSTKKNIELIYVIAGKETALVDAECDKLIETLVNSQQKTTALFSADPTKISAYEVLDELRTLPFLADKRVVLIRSADNFISQNRELLDNYFDSPSATGILIMAVSSWPSNTKLAKKLKGVGKLINITQPKPWQLPTRLIQYAKDAYDKKITKEAAELLVELTGDDLVRLYSEVDKLFLFSADENTITAQHVESLTGHNRLFNVFSTIDALTSGNSAEAVNRLRNLFDQDESAGYTIVGAFAFHFRRMFNAKALLNKGQSVPQVALQVHIWSKKEAFFSQIRRMSLHQIGTYLQNLAETDFAIKTGRTTPRVAIEQMVLQLTTKIN